MKLTEKALLARSVNSQVAHELTVFGWTIGKLKQESPKKLSALGFSKQQIENLLSEDRPPIPTKNMTRVLFRNRFQCCICRNPDNPIIVHHIKPWSKSQSHDETNLAVLCLRHHDSAHSKSTLSKNLDAAAIRNAKLKWEEDCENFDAQSILSASRLSHAAWLYFNHLRLFGIASELSIKFQKVSGYRDALNQNLIRADGQLLKRSETLSYMYDDGSGQTLYHYVKSVLDEVLHRITIVNASDILDKGSIAPLLVTGDFLFIQGAHNFKHLTKKRSGKGEVMQGSRRANQVEVRYTFDRWEATSCSSWATWLTARQSVGSLVHVKSINREGNILVVAGTILAISNGHSQLQQRSYSARYGNFMVYSDDEDDVEDWAMLGDDYS